MATAKRRVLLVDDEPRILDSVRMNLELEGFEVNEANNGLEAIDKLRRFLPDLVVLDVMMPEMDGFEAIRRIRAIERHADLPIIVLTAKAMARAREQCLKAGATDYLAKPVDLDQLRSMLRVWLYKTRN
jgi:CheY-like chemotaxis protein